VPLQQIFDALNTALSGGDISLSADTVDGIGSALAALGITDTLELTRANLALDERAVVLTGNAQYRSFGWVATLTGEAVGENNRFTLALQGLDAETKWAFGTSFAGLPEGRRIDHSTTGRLAEPRRKRSCQLCRVSRRPHAAARGRRRFQRPRPSP
jgi:hypothetical protein